MISPNLHIKSPKLHIETPRLHIKSCVRQVGKGVIQEIGDKHAWNKVERYRGGVPVDVLSRLWAVRKTTKFDRSYVVAAPSSGEIGSGYRVAASNECNQVFRLPY